MSLQAIVVEADVAVAAKAMTIEARAVDATVGEDVSGKKYFQRINPQVLNIESSTEIRGTSIEEE